MNQNNKEIQNANFKINENIAYFIGVFHYGRYYGLIIP